MRIEEGGDTLNRESMKAGKVNNITMFVLVVKVAGSGGLL
jgi:hypothetical protein